MSARPRAGLLYSAGALLAILVLPLFVYALFCASNSTGFLTLVPLRAPQLPQNAPLFSWTALQLVYCWFTLLLVLHLLLPGKLKQGVVEPDGNRWTYKLNAFRIFCLTYATIFVLAFVSNTLPLYWLADHYLELLTASTLFSAALASALHLFSYQPGTCLSHEATTGSPPFDFWMGRCLNPRLGSVDLKEFCELTPGLIGWAVLNLSMAHKQLTATGEVSPAMVFVNVAQLVYVCDALWFEPSILTTMDIVSEGFGFMLVFGDLTWVPFVYSIQARFLLDHPQALSWPWMVCVSALATAGYFIFRGSNSQKDQFRTNPQDPRVSHLKTLPTERGTRLICSGWWGLARHINYTGDWLLSLAWCLACGFDSVVPYFYATYFAILLVTREWRDDRACKAKYGRDWDKYCSLVPYRLIPFVY